MTKIFHARRYGRSTEIQNKFRRKKLHRTNQGSKFLRGSFINRGHDMIIIRMLKLYGPSLCEPLSIIFKSCLRQMKFPMEWKKTNVVPIQKKKKMINSASKTTDRSLCFWSAVRSLKDFYLTSCISFLMKMIYYHPTSEAFDPVNLA